MKLVIVMLLHLPATLVVRDLLMSSADAWILLDRGTFRFLFPADSLYHSACDCGVALDTVAVAKSFILAITTFSLRLRDPVASRDRRSANTVWRVALRLWPISGLRCLMVRMLLVMPTASISRRLDRANGRKFNVHMRRRSRASLHLCVFALR
jgi:hypothetical protein